eukprot:g18723.t1
MRRKSGARVRLAANGLLNSKCTFGINDTTTVLEMRSTTAEGLPTTTANKEQLSPLLQMPFSDISIAKREISESHSDASSVEGDSNDVKPGSEGAAQRGKGESRHRRRAGRRQQASAKPAEAYKTQVDSKDATKSRKVFVGGIAWSVDDETFEKLFAQFGTVLEAKVLRDAATGVPRGYGFVTYQKLSSATKAVKAGKGSKLRLGGRRIDCKFALPTQEAGQYVRKLYVGGLDSNVTEKTLIEHFSKYGEIKNAVVMVNRHTGQSRGFGFVNRHTGQSRGFGFVTFAHIESVADALATPQNLGGKKLEICKAVSREQLDTAANSKEQGPWPILHSAPGGTSMSTLSSYPFNHFEPQCQNIARAVNGPAYFSLAHGGPPYAVHHPNISSLPSREHSNCSLLVSHGPLSLPLCLPVAFNSNLKQEMGHLPVAFNSNLKQEMGHLPVAFNSNLKQEMGHLPVAFNSNLKQEMGHLPVAFNSNLKQEPIMPVVLSQASRSPSPVVNANNLTLAYPANWAPQYMYPPNSVHRPMSQVPCSPTDPTHCVLP